MNPNAIYRPRKILEDGIILEGAEEIVVDREHLYPQPDGTRVWWMNTLEEGPHKKRYGYGMWRLDEVEEIRAR